MRISWMLAPAAAAALAVSQGTSELAPRYELIPIDRPHHRHADGPRVREAGMVEGTSSNWSGYAVETNLASPQSNAVTDVAGSWTVPAVVKSQSKTTYSSNWVGIDGYSDGTVEQLGTDSDWSRGAPSYYAWFEMYPGPAYLIGGFVVAPGDAVSASVHYNGGSSYQLTIDNTTRGEHFSQAFTGSAQRSSAEWITEAPSSGRVLPLADFGSTTFTDCSATLNGHTGAISDSAWQYDELTMAGRGYVKAVPSDLSSDGSSFGVTWYHE
jgi:hypothetical protein